MLWPAGPEEGVAAGAFGDEVLVFDGQAGLRDPGAVGVGIGWAIDRWAGTSPWGLIVFLLLGFAAAVLNVLRSAGMVAEQGSKLPPKDGGSG